MPHFTAGAVDERRAHRIATNGDGLKAAGLLEPREQRRADTPIRTDDGDSHGGLRLSVVVAWP